MGVALVTGASSGIGHEICLRLLDAGFLVYGVGRTFRDGDKLKCLAGFTPVVFDLSGRNVEDMCKKVRDMAKPERISLVVNCAGAGYFGPHEQISARAIHEMVAVNLEAPMIITSFFLRDLKSEEGMVINISSVTALKSNTHGCAYGATKAGLTSFGHSLFDEVRKYGVGCVNIHPDMTESDFYRNADFTSCDEPDARLVPEEVAELVMTALNMRKGAVITDMTVKPQKHRIIRKN